MASVFSQNVKRGHISHSRDLKLGMELILATKKPMTKLPNLSKVIRTKLEYHKGLFWAIGRP